jgi:hypothetical protein
MRFPAGRRQVSVDRAREDRSDDWEERASYDATPTPGDRRLFVISIASLALATLVVVALWLAH